MYRNSKQKINLAGWLIGLYVIFPMYFRIGSISVYYFFLLLAGFIILVEQQAILRIPKLAFRPWWWFAIAGAMVPMLYHGEWSSIIMYTIAPIMLVLMIYNSANNEKGFIKLIEILIQCATFISLCAIVESVTGFNIFEVLRNDGTTQSELAYRYNLLRVTSSFENAINLSVFLSIATMLVLYRMSISVVRRFQWIICFVLIWVANILTVSRAPLLMCAVINLALATRGGLLRFNKKILMGITFILLALVLLEMLGYNTIGVLQQIFCMFMVIVDPSYKDLVYPSFGTNVGGIGNRLDLFHWVWDSIKDHQLFGYGKGVPFAYRVNEFGLIKRSIENQYLSRLYRYGVFGMGGQILTYLGILAHLIIPRNRKLLTFEGKLSFRTMLLFACLGYFLAMLAVAQLEERKIFFCLIGLLFIYECSLKERQLDQLNTVRG